MPAKSKSQWRLMKGIAEGSIKPRKGLPTKAQAREFIASQSTPKGLKERKRRK